MRRILSVVSTRERGLMTRTAPPSLRRTLCFALLHAMAMSCDARPAVDRSSLDEIGAGAGHLAGTRTLPESLRQIARIGDTNAFGTIDGVREVEGARVAVLDAVNGTVSLYSREGRLIFRFGRRGAGPGEFGAAVDMEEDQDGNLLVLDRGTQRVSVLRIVGDSIGLGRTIQLRLTPGDMCLIAGRLFVLGLLGGKLVHEINAEGDIVRSFGSRPDTNRFKDAIAGMGRLACSEAGQAIALVPRTLKEIYIYSVQGALLRRDSIPGYSEIVYATQGPSVRPTTPASGFWNEIAALTWIDDHTLLVQLHREPTPGGALVQGWELRVNEGWASVPRIWPRVADVVGNTIYATEADPYPLVKVYRVR